MNAKTIIGFVIAFAIGGLIGYGYGLLDNGATANEVRDKLKGTQSAQRTITEGLGDAAQKVKRAGELIGECQYILQRVRSQPAGETPPN